MSKYNKKNRESNETFGEPSRTEIEELLGGEAIDFSGITQKQIRAILEMVEAGKSLTESILAITDIEINVNVNNGTVQAAFLKQAVILGGSQNIIMNILKPFK